jgi:hypothetical protein
MVYTTSQRGVDVEAVLATGKHAVELVIDDSVPVEARATRIEQWTMQVGALIYLSPSLIERDMDAETAATIAHHAIYGTYAPEGQGQWQPTDTPADGPQARDTRCMGGGGAVFVGDGQDLRVVTASVFEIQYAHLRGDVTRPD